MLAWGPRWLRLSPCRLNLQIKWGQEVKANLAHPLSSESPLKIQRHLVQLLAIRILIACQQPTQLCLRPFIYYILLLAMALWTNLETFSNGAVNFINHVVFLCRQGAQWTLRYIRNWAIMPVALLRPAWIHHVFLIPSCPRDPLPCRRAAPAVCWGGCIPPPLFGFGEVRICCVWVHQLKGQFSRYMWKSSAKGVSGLHWPHHTAVGEPFSTCQFTHTLNQ